MRYTLKDLEVMKRNRLLQHSHLGNTQACFYNFCKLTAASFKHICGGYVASYPELPGCLTCADTLEEVITNAIDAKKAWLKTALEDSDTIQEPKYNEETIAALKEAEEISKNPSKYKGYSSVEEMIKDILKEDIE